MQALAHRAGSVHSLIEMSVLSRHFSSFQLSKNIIQWAEYSIVTSTLQYSHGLRNEMHFCGSGVFTDSFNAPIFCCQGIANTSALWKRESSEERSQAKSLLR